MNESSFKNKIIIFDGICLLCNSAVYFLHEKLNNHNYKFVASQSVEGKVLVDKYKLENLPKETVILIDDNKIITKTNALLQIIDDMPLKWRLFKIFKIVPRFIRDWFYDLISKNRHLILGKFNGNRKSKN